MRPEWRARLAAWIRRLDEKLRQKWWLWPALLFEKMAEHQFLGSLNEFLLARSGAVASFLRSTLAFLFLHPTLIPVTLALLIVVTLAVKAYFEGPAPRGDDDLTAGEIEHAIDARIAGLAPRAAPVASQDQAQTTGAASLEGFEQLRQVFGELVQAAGPPCRYLKQDFLQAVDGEHSSCARLVSRLFREYTLPAYVEVYAKLYPRIEREDLEPDELPDLIDRFNHVVAQYYVISNFALWSGRLFLGAERLTSDPLYAGWCQAHQGLMEAVRKAGERRDLRKIKDCLPSLTELLSALRQQPSA